MPGGWPEKRNYLGSRHAKIRSRRPWSSGCPALLRRSCTSRRRSVLASTRSTTTLPTRPSELLKLHAVERPSRAEVAGDQGDPDRPEERRLHLGPREHRPSRGAATVSNAQHGPGWFRCYQPSPTWWRWCDPKPSGDRKAHRHLRVTGHRASRRRTLLDADRVPSLRREPHAGQAVIGARSRQLRLSVVRTEHTGAGPVEDHAGRLLGNCSAIDPSSLPLPEGSKSRPPR